jgi:AcrR family transcriptional regulator
MGMQRDELLGRIVSDVAAHGLGDRSLRDIAAAVGSSHRMVLYHFGSRAGLVQAIVESVEAGQRQLLADAAAAAPSATSADLIRATWARVSDPAVRQFVRLFFELVGHPETDRLDLTGTWLDEAGAVARARGQSFDPAGVRVGIAVTRGLLIDVVTGGDRDEATAALERFIELLPPDRPADGR